MEKRMRNPIMYYRKQIFVGIVVCLLLCGMAAFCATEADVKKQDGLYMERILSKKLQTYLYQNDKRIYKTKNRYTVMMNREYDRRRLLDSQDKKLKKELKKEVKNRKKQQRKSRLKRIA